MKGYSKKRQALACIMAVILTVLVFYTFFPIPYYAQDSDLPPSGMSGAQGNAHQSLAVITLPASEDLGRTTLSQAAFKGWQNWYRCIYTTLGTQPGYFTGIAFLVLCFINLFTRVNKRISVIALPIGGHAPPAA